MVALLNFGSFEAIVFGEGPVILGTGSVDRRLENLLGLYAREQF